MDVFPVSTARNSMSVDMRMYIGLQLDKLCKTSLLMLDLVDGSAIRQQQITTAR